MDRHRQAVEKLTHAIENASAPITQQRKGSHRTHRPKLKSTLKVPLNRILKITDHSVTCEPGVTMEQLVKATLRHGLIPEVVPEFRHITVGGAIAGGALESSSHQFGQFFDSCTSLEVILGNGEIVTTSDDELFYALSGSYGTLGLITLATIRLIPAKPYVSIEYIQSDTLLQPSGHFFDGLYENGSYTFMRGTLTDEPASKFRGLFHKKRPTHMQLTDYLFRYDKGAFWMSPAPLSSKTLYRWLPLLEKHLLIQDAYIPYDRAEEFLQETYGISPIWLCPVKSTQTPQLFSPSQSTAPLLLNIGTYGRAQHTPNFEERIHAHGGRKMLYSRSSYSPEQFWTIYDKSTYDHLRHTYHATDTFPSIEEKL